MNFKKIFHSIKSAIRRLRSIEDRCVKIQEALGRIESRQVEHVQPGKFTHAEFRVFSQWGEDGILQHLLRHVPISKKIFVEFGVETYVESNTRFLLTENHWAGLVIDGSQENINFIKQDAIYWQQNLKAEAAFITRENINELINRNGIHGEIGILSIDIDGNDYWVWEAIDTVTPSIVVIEYNSRFGDEKAVSIPYSSEFTRTAAHHSNIYYGASLAAMCMLATRKGYDFVGCNSAGVNAFFVRSDHRPPSLPALTAKQGFVRAAFRESRDPDGNLAFLAEAQEQEILHELPFVDVS